MFGVIGVILFVVLGKTRKERVMRQALFGQEFLLNSSGEIMGIRLGYDHCYEHECGIEHIQRALGIPIDPVENP